MINEIVNAIVKALDTAFNAESDAYEIYNEEIKQDLREPAFFVQSINPSTSLFLGKRYDGNFYLSDFDHFMKEVVHVKHYYRYMDDICVFADSKEELHRILVIMENYLNTELNLRVKDNYQIFPTFIRGVDFVGYRIFRHYTLLRKSTADQLKQKMTAIRIKVESGHEMNYSEWCSINSYQGWLKYCDSNRLSEKYIDPLLPYADSYYKIHVKKGGKNNEKSWNCQKLCAA